MAKTLFNSHQPKPRISVIGIGYVGLPLAIALATHYTVIAYDINVNRIRDLRNGIDSTHEYSSYQLHNCVNVIFTSTKSDIASSDIYIITVPTPVDNANKPNLSPLVSATSLVAGYLSKGNTVIYESTVYPGVTEDICVPILEKISGLAFNTDFYCGYSPERINPADKEHTLDNVIKIVSGSNDHSLNLIDDLYRSVVSAGTFRASSIRVAEAAKVIENAQRDLNIAFVNELSLIFSRIGIDTDEVLKAASTKWNFISLKPGLVGGHCIGVDPYYLAYKAEEIGYHPELILAGRRINDGMASHIVSTLFKQMSANMQSIAGSTIGILGVTFKDNCPDTRNSKVFDIIKILHDWGASTLVADPLANPDAVFDEHNVRIVEINSDFKVDALIVAVKHDQYCAFMPSDLRALTKLSNPVLFDVKSIYPVDILENEGFTVVRL